MMRQLVYTLCAVSVISLGIAQHSDATRQNAALRYWMAFAEMSNPILSSQDATTMDAVLRGASPWNEQALGFLVKENQPALETMIRASQLPVCDWGIEYERGPEAPIAHLPKARALARLNALYVRHLASTRDFSKAVRALAAGFRFAQHLAENAPFLGALLAKDALVPHLIVAKELVANQQVTYSDRRMLQQVLSSLPEGGSSWAAAARLEGQSAHLALLRLSQSADPHSFYRVWFGQEPPSSFRAPGPQDMTALNDAMTLYASLLAMPAERSLTEIALLEERLSQLSPVARLMVASPRRLIEARLQVASLQKEVQTLLSR